ncbi:MAG: sigma-54-dependent Fis family transcriptional regulator [Proteobacteria bacterium]|nr:sigma-54-dependent Fis family transcriptional regulator [Pseudomonadota bacterium]
MTSREVGAALRQARHMLTERGEVPGGLIDELVARSWRRCMESGLAPVGRLGEAPHLSAAELGRSAERQHELIANARPVMEYLFTQTRNSGSMVILADDRGMLLQALGDANFLTRAERVALAPGSSWNERYRGTNAIGTALAEGTPVVVHGAEHYLERNGFLTCAAAPITSPDGRLLGVLDISGEHRSRHPHTFGLVRGAAQMIENRLFDARHGAGVRLRFHPLAEGIGTVAEGVAALSEDGWIVGANQTGLSLLGLVSADLGATPLSRIFELRIGDLIDWASSRPGQPLLVDRVNGGRLFVRIDPGRRPLSPARANTAFAKPKDVLSILDTGDKSMHSAIDRARRVSGKSISLLLQGESGVGKEVFARAIHESGPRNAKPFVAVNCAALPETLIEAELFGYAPGAFTGARREGMPGRLREAHGGTLFLDEIGDMPLAVQGRLLRVLQERQVTPLGGGKPANVDFALICATHRKLKAEMGAGRFREDLLIEEAAPGRGIVLSVEVTAAFANYRWPGNLRQLVNALRTACAMLDEDEGCIAWRHLPDDLMEDLRSQTTRPAPIEISTIENLRDLSDSMIGQTVRTAGGNISEAARRLGISRNTLYRRLRRGNPAQPKSLGRAG